MQNLISKWGTYLSLAAVAITAGLQAYGIMVPEFVYVLEGAVGLTAIRTTVSVAGAGLGWRSYGVAAIAGVLAAAQAYGIMVPEFVYGLLTTAGFGTLTLAVKKI